MSAITKRHADTLQDGRRLARVREEADRVIGDREPTVQDVTKLEYIGCVVRETFRRYPAGWILGRAATRDANLRGYPIRKGEFLGISPLVAQRLAESWPDPDRFDPERFAGDKTNGNRNFTYFPFGAGPHSASASTSRWWRCRSCSRCSPAAQSSWWRIPRTSA